MSTYYSGRVSFGRIGRQSIPILTFVSQKSLYFNVPPHQRYDDLWPYWKQQLFIDSLLRGPEFMPLPEFVLNQEWEITEDGKERLKYTTQDGLQRLSVIYKFVDGKMKTFNQKEYQKHILIKGLKPIPFDKHYGELPDVMKQEFLAYPLPVQVAEKASPIIAGERFRRLNLGTPTSAGEDLRSYQPTAATELADKIGSHSMWPEMFQVKKRKDRRYHFEMALYIIYMSIHGFPAELSRNTLKLVAAGTEDHFITSEFGQEILSDLENLSLVFSGTEISAKTDAIPLWEAGILLKKASCNFQRSKLGCLNNWFTKTKRMMLHGYTYGNLSLFAGMTHKDLQQKFWADQRSVLLEQEGLVFDDSVQWNKVRDVTYQPEKPSAYALIHENGTVAVPSDFVDV